jgi:hypothetical protein
VCCNYQGKQRDVPESEQPRDAETEDLVMLVRQRKSRIYFLRRFFDYPIKMSADTFKNLGLVRTMRCGFSYLRTAVLPKREEKRSRTSIINRFGRSSTSHSSSRTPKRCGACPATRSAPSGARSASRGSR